VIAPPAGAPAGFQNVWVVDADCAIEPATAISGALSRPVLFGGAGGAPVLWTGDRWLRWAPFDAAFEPLDVLEQVPVLIDDATASPDTGLAMWLDTTAQSLVALRFDVRGEYSTVPPAMLTADASEMAPDRLAGAGVAAFDTTIGGLVLAPGASAFLTDRTYADVAIDVDAPTGEPVLVVLRDELGQELEVGGASCFGASAPGISSVHVERRGASVTWSVAGGPSSVCGASVGASARLSLGLRGVSSASRSVARDLRVSRLGP
jgi:hypothetical protein